MNRRNFLASLIAAATMDPEKLLFVPGKRLISIPKPRLTELTMFAFKFKPGPLAGQPGDYFALGVGHPIWGDGSLFESGYQEEGGVLKFTIKTKIHLPELQSAVKITGIGL